VPNHYRRSAVGSPAFAPMRFRHRSDDDWWDDYTDDPVVDYSGLLVVTVADDEPWDGLVDVRGEPLFTEAPPFGFCSQRET
jgi:hypothetical protein